jgi:hypothetical protein
VGDLSITYIQRRYSSSFTELQPDFTNQTQQRSLSSAPYSNLEFPPLHTSAPPNTLPSISRPVGMYPPDTNPPYVLSGMHSLGDLNNGLNYGLDSDLQGTESLSHTTTSTHDPSFPSSSSSSTSSSTQPPPTTPPTNTTTTFNPVFNITTTNINQNYMQFMPYVNGGANPGAGSGGFKGRAEDALSS